MRLGKKSYHEDLLKYKKYIKENFLSYGISNA